MPRVNRAIELLSQDQPIYYHTTQDLTYEGGVKAAATWADFINVDMEHHPYDIAGLSKFMEGLVSAGPTRSGHRAPAVIAVVPVTAKEEYIIRANAWMFTQVLCAGVHGILMTHCNSPAAVRAFVESCRYPFNLAGVGEGLGEGDVGRVVVGHRVAELPGAGREAAVRPVQNAHFAESRVASYRRGRVQRTAELLPAKGVAGLELLLLQAASVNIGHKACREARLLLREKMRMP